MPSTRGSMIGRRSASALTLLLGATLVVAACGGSAATTAPTAATQAPPSLAPQTFALPSFGLPSFNSDPELEAMFPKDVGGETLTVISMNGTDFVGTAGAQLTPVLTKLGKSPADLSAAFGGTMAVTITALKIKGVAADQFLSAFTANLQGVPGASITDASFGGKTVKRIVPKAGEDAVYIYLKDDVVWSVGGPAITDALLDETFSKLP